MAGTGDEERRGRADVPPSGDPDAFPANGDGLSANGDGLSWCWELDMQALLAAVSGPAPWLRAVDPDGPAGDPDGPASREPAGSPGFAGVDEDPEAEEAAYQEAVATGRVRELPLDVVAGRVAESLPAGPGLAGWLAQARAADLEDGALAGVASSFRRLASWAAAGELAAVAQIASRSARSDRRAEVDPLGRPNRITTDATGQVALALAMSQDGASSWTDLAVVLTWRLPATGAALAAGQIDLPRARMIARLTTPLSDEAARAVEAAVLDRAGWLTLGQLHAALLRAVVKADPEGAERRREEAERNAKVTLYPEDEGTATLAGYGLPGVHAAAAMARVTMLAKAMRAAGTAGGIDLVRAQVFLGLLLGTLSFPPAGEGGLAAGGGSGGEGGPAGGGPGGEGGPRGEGGPADPPANGHGVPVGQAGEGPDGDGDAAYPMGVGAPASGLSWDRVQWLGKAGPWPGVPGTLTGTQPAAGGLLNLTVPFATLAGTSAMPGQLSRLGMITAGQARQLAVLATQHPATRWRIVVTSQAGQAIAVTHLPRARASPSVTMGSAASEGTGLIRRVTVIMDVGMVGARVPDAGVPGVEMPRAEMPGLEIGSALRAILDRVRGAARRAAEQAAERDQEDAQAGGCAHGQASAGYRPPPRIAELVTARDGTCRFGPCRRPAEQCDLDHTIPFGKGGLTCSCNLGGS